MTLRLFTTAHAALYTGQQRLAARLRDDQPEQGASLETIVLTVALVGVAIAAGAAILAAVTRRSAGL
jgi:hypothetical protein